MNILSRQIQKLIARWFTAEEARKIAYNTQVKNWNIKAWTFELTDKWEYYSNLTPEQRKKRRNFNSRK